MTMTPKEAAFIDFIHRGVFRVDRDGTVWRTGEITRGGRIRPVAPRRADKIRPDGYSNVRVQANKQVHVLGAHRFVWLVFNGEIPEGMEINHINGMRSDNRLENLEVVTPGGNLQHAYSVLGRRSPAGERNGRHKLTSQQVRELRLAFEQGESKKSLARRFGISPPMVRRILDGRAWRDEFPAESP